MKDNFKFFMPIGIRKSKDGEGKEVMRIGGVASTKERDADGEVLDPNGFELDYFLKSGFINWNHQSSKNPESIIGEPTLAKIKDDGLYIEGMLYKNSDMAKKVYKLADTLSKSQSKRKLGFSIEGKVIERDPLDDKKIKKAKITGLAITPSPKNPGTILDVIKGNFVEDEEEKFEGDYIIDIVKGDGERITVDKDYNINIIEKGLDTDSGEPVMKESVEGSEEDEKKKEKQKKLQKDCKGNEKTITFGDKVKKALIFKKLSSLIKGFDKCYEATNIIFDKLNSLEMAIDNKEKLEELKKSLDSLGIKVSEEDLIKGYKKKAEEEPEEEKEEGSEEEEDDMEKAIKAKEDELEKMKAAYEKKKKSMTQNVDTVQKGIDYDLLADKVVSKMSESGLIIKGDTKEEKPSEDITKGEDLSKEKNDDIKKSIDEDLKKGFEAITDKISDFQKSINERITNIENQSQGRKSVTTKNYIEKSFGLNEDQLKDKKVLSISKHRTQVSKLLMNKSNIEKGGDAIDERYVQAVQDFEASSNIQKSLIDEIAQDDNILIIP